MNKTHHSTCLKSVFVGLGQRLADVAHKSRPLGNSALCIVSKQNDSSKKISVLKDVIQIVCWNPEGVFSLIWPIRGCAAGQRMVFVLAVLNRVYNFARVCPKQSMQFRTSLS